MTTTGPGARELLEQLRAEQHDDVTLPADRVLAGFLAGCDPAVVVLDLAARAAPVEARMLAHQPRRTA